MAPLQLEECIRIPGQVQVHDMRLCFLHGGISYGKYHWRFTALDLFDKQLSFHVTFDGITKGARWDRISLPRGIKDGFVEFRRTTRILAEMIAMAFGRTEVALRDNELPLVCIESDVLTKIGSSVDLSVWVHHQYFAKKRA